MKPRSSILRLVPLTCFGLAAISGGCLTRPLEPIDSRTTWTANFKQPQSAVDKIDLVLMIDNSGSMADKQAILADAVPQLVKGLLQPPCIDKDNKPIDVQPAGPLDACPAGSVREFTPITDVHIGIISSSLGGHGSGSCTVSDQSGYNNPSNNDAGHLISRLDPTNPGAKEQTWNNQGFLAWDPKQTLTPPGEATADTTVEKLRNMVKGVGQIGCGWEASLESWYRFLVDPEPYATIGLDANGNYTPSGVDHELLAERAAFLRPDSLVAIIMLTDENDCSTIESGKYPIINKTDANFHMRRARSICATKPNDRCCTPCDETPVDCPADPQCAAKPFLGIDENGVDEDPVGLRCWDQKRRFGKDFLYPVKRYVDALTQAKVQRSNGDWVDNPLFPPDPDGKLRARMPGGNLVFLAGIIGVPWQDIARRNDKGELDLLAGFMNSDELSTRVDAYGGTTWDVILGDPANGVPPKDPLMIESRKPRSGQNPVTGDKIAPTNATDPKANPINGHEWNTDKSTNGADLQYACIFDLKAENQQTCSPATGCDCAPPVDSTGQNPLCQNADGSYSATQRRAKGYPGIRQLSVLKELRKQGIVASVCPAQIDHMERADYGYSPAIGSIIERLKAVISEPCLTRPLTPDAEGHVACVVVEASKSDGGVCCSGAARSQVSADHAGALTAAKAEPSAVGYDCFCEIDQLSGEGLGICQTQSSLLPVDASGRSVDGWCYVDNQTGPAELVTSCPDGQKYKVRYVGAGAPSATATTFITCAGDEG